MLAEANLLARFETVRRRRDDEWMACCPAHADRTPSLHITRARDKWLLKCHAGCETELVVGALGLDWGDLFEDDDRRDEIVARYPYVDTKGRLLYEVVRFWPKSFRQRQPNGSGWIWNLRGVQRVLYRLPEVSRARKRGQVIWVAEGEKDVAALERAGVTATCSPGGAKKWRHEYSATLARTNVALLIDRDEAGREHALHIVGSLERHGCTVKVGRPVYGKDAFDHLMAGHGLDEFVRVDPASWTAVASPDELLTELTSQFRSADELRSWLGRKLGCTVRRVQTVADRQLEIDELGAWERRLSGGT